MTTDTHETRMHAVAHAIAQYYPAFIEEIQGCTSAEISKLQTVIGRPLPRSYVEFLQLMGHSTGSLVFFDSADFTFGSVLRRHANKKVLRPPERYLLFGIAKDDPYYNFYLDCGISEPQVTRFPTPETAEEFPEVISQQEWLASSLYELVFSKAFFDFRIPQFAHENMLAEDTRAPITFEQMESVMKKLGFSRHPQSSTAIVYYERPTSAVVLSRFVGSPLSLTVAAHERREIAKLSDVLAQHFHLIVPR